MATSRSFGELVAEGAAEPVEGWDFSWFEQLARLHERIQSRGPFVSHAQRFLIEARKPTSR